MTNRRVLVTVLLALMGVCAYAQSWMTAYDKGLKAAKSGDWESARASFQQAIAYRPEDTGNPTTLPGPVSDRKQWRNGAPYSPNFLAAYSEYRIGVGSPKAEDGKSALQTAATEFETLVSKGQNSKETFFFLDQIYTRLGDTAKRQDIEDRYKATRMNFRVDTEIVAPEELAVITGASSGTTGTKQGAGPVVTIKRPGQSPTPVPSSGLPGTAPDNGVIPAVGPVAPLSSKFALVIGNSTSQLKGGAVSFASDDAQAIREALVTNSGYPEANVDLVLNTTKDQLLASAKALADRVPEDGTVFIFFAGNGVNIDGKDYLAGVDSASDSDPSTMVAKMDIYRLFMAKGAKIYAFFEAPRPTVNGAYFGKEIPMVGAIAQVQSTIPGDGISSEVHNGHQMGLFAFAMISALQDIRSNRIPIMEFGWQVFNRIRGGVGGMSGAGARQVPTLPVLTHISGDDRF
ncbi:MAG TPA: caspase family protein [Fimbriimonadaceae bacterium]|nr:caspase family protein [Fimbriimonadaceae bacterium]